MVREMLSFCVCMCVCACMCAHACVCACMCVRVAEYNDVSLKSHADCS